MSCYFRLGEDDLWNPSNVVARLFLAEAIAIEGVIGVQCGIGTIEDDESVIDDEQFTEFVAALLREYKNSNNETLRALVEGVLGVSLVLLGRARRNIVEMDSETMRSWDARLQKLSRSMPPG